MYITITAQNTSKGFSQSVKDYVNYLEKENEGKDIDETEYFFDQHGQRIEPTQVIKEIDSNGSKLKKSEPKFYSITVSPSKYELGRLTNTSEDLKKYTLEIMRDYAACFNREINGRAVTEKDLKWYAKIEYQRSFKGTDKQVKENQPYATKILQLKTDLRKIEWGELPGDAKILTQKIDKLEKAAPHQQNGERIVQGIRKEGNQAHIHIIISRKDVTNSFSISPGSKYKASEVEMNGKMVKRGFDRDAFFSKAEKTFDNSFGYKRNYVETYVARKTQVKNPQLYIKNLLGLPSGEKAIAFKLMREAGIPIVNIPTNNVQLAMSSIQRLKRGVTVAIRSSSIGI